MSYRADRFTVVMDTNVLVGALKRNILLSLAEVGIFRPRWSAATINDEFKRFFSRKYPEQQDLGPRHRGSIIKAFPEGIAVEDPAVIEALQLPDPDDRHVLAAAIQTKASLIITDNTKDFPADVLLRHELETATADEFVADCIDLAGPDAVASLRKMRERLRNPAFDAESLLVRMEEVGLIQTSTLLAPFKSLL